MALKTEILSELERLIQLGSSLADAQDRSAIRSHRPEHDFREFVIGAKASIRRIAGTDSEYFRMLHLPITTSTSIARESSVISSFVGSLKALHSAVSFDWLERLETRLRANIHDDFLEQAKTLLEAGFHVAAIVLIGGVLEDHLRKLCEVRGLTWKGKGSLSQYNDLLKAEYAQPIWRQIQVVTDLRNDAAHGAGAKIDAKHVEDAHAFVARTVAIYPA